MNSDASWNNFNQGTLLPFGPILTVDFDIANSLTDRYEVMSYAAEPRSTASGATPSVGELTGNLELTAVWPADSSGHGHADHFWHSAEFRGNSWQQWSDWSRPLGAEVMS